MVWKSLALFWLCFGFAVKQNQQVVSINELVVSINQLAVYVKNLKKNC